MELIMFIFNLHWPIWVKFVHDWGDYGGLSRVGNSGSTSAWIATWYAIVILQLIPSLILLEISFSASAMFLSHNSVKALILIDRFRMAYYPATALQAWRALIGRCGSPWLTRFSLNLLSERWKTGIVHRGHMTCGHCEGWPFARHSLASVMWNNWGDWLLSWAPFTNSLR